MCQTRWLLGQQVHIHRRCLTSKAVAAAAQRVVIWSRRAQTLKNAFRLLSSECLVSSSTHLYPIVTFLSCLSKVRGRNTYLQVLQCRVWNRASSFRPYRAFVVASPCLITISKLMRFLQTPHSEVNLWTASSRLFSAPTSPAFVLATLQDRHPLV